MVKTVFHTYENNEQFKQILQNYEEKSNSTVFVQVFSTNINQDFYNDVYQEIRETFFNATVIGIPTTNSIVRGRKQREETVVAFTSFKTSTLNVLAIKASEWNETYVKKQTFLQNNTKAVVTLSIGEKNYAELVQQKLQELDKKIAILGGAIKKENNLEQSFIFYNGQFIEDGIITIGYQGEELEAYCFQTFDFEELGPMFEVTKAKGNIIFEINGRKAQDVIKGLLGPNLTDLKASTLYQFPLLLNNAGSEYPVFIRKIDANGNIECNREIPIASKITMTIINYDGVINQAIKNIKKLSRQNIESILTFNCFGKNAIMEDFMIKHLEDLELIAPTYGLFTHGEFVRSNHEDIQFVGMAFTYLGLTENTSMKKEIPKKTFTYERPVVYDTIRSLIHLLKTNESEYTEKMKKLSKENDISQLLFDKTEDLIYSINLNEEFMFVNARILRHFDKEREEIIGKHISEVISKSEYNKIRKYIHKAFKGQEVYFNVKLLVKENIYHEFVIQQIPIIENGKVVEVYSIGRNITLLKEYEEKIINLSQYDKDTGLPHKIKFIEEFDRAIKRATNKKTKVGLLAIDIDRFKKINDNLGHKAGDIILRQIASRIDRCLDSNFYIGRFSEDKFFIFFNQDVKEENIKFMAQSILKEIAQPIYFQKKEIYLTASIGVSIFPQDGKKSSHLIKNADIAVDIAKFNGGNQLKFFANTMTKDAVNRLELESALHMALSRNEFELHYQPLIDIKSKKVVSAEALLRWNSKAYGYVMPSAFIPITEETGMINSIGKWVLFEACKQAREWQQKGFEELGISVNVSVKQFRQPTFVSHIESILEKTALEPKYLTLELTESTTLEDIDYSIETIRELQKLGVKVAIDDFGTGYSSLSYLKNLPIDILKIDRSFIMQLDQNTSDQAIVQAIIMMTKGLEIKILAEGVENQQQLELLKKLNCDYAQGYYISKPIPKEEFYNQLGC